MLQEQGLGDDGVDTAGSHQLGDGDDKLKREEKQVTHPEGRLPGMPRRTRLLADGASRYDLRIRTPQVVDDQEGSVAFNGRYRVIAASRSAK